MKQFGLLLIGLLLLIGCKNDDDTDKNPVDQNKVLVLKIDFETYTFEEGKELIFNTDKDFEITSEYVAPGDFGGITLFYKDTEEKLFSGTIVWAGMGAISYPKDFKQAKDFKRIDTPLQMPDVTVFQKVMYDDHAYYPDTIEYQKIWESIDDLEIVKEFRTGDPNASIHLLVYTPAVGILDPAAADWVVIINN